MVPKGIPLILLLACINGFLGVAVGAFGSHALKASLTPDALALVDLASRYLLIHGAAGLGVAFMVRGGYVSPKAGLLMQAGVFVFALALLLISVAGWRAGGILAPFGGTAMLAAWGWLVLAALGAFSARR